MFRFARAFLLAAVATFAIALPAAHAQTYPAKPIRVIVPSTPGDGSDLMARAIGDKLGAAWNTPVVVCWWSPRRFPRATSAS